MKLICALLFAAFALVNADTPANCLFSDIEGTWVISETERIYDSSVTCEDSSSMTFPYSKTFTFSYPDLVTDEDLGTTGTWTLVYNQGWEFTINERSYFAFSYYEEEADGSVTSYCDNVFPGWSRDTTVRNWSCYSAVKTVSGATRVTGKKDRNGLKNNYRVDRELIKSINSAKLSWHARSYPEFEKYTIEEMIARAGGLANAELQLPPTAPATQEQKERAALLPVDFDWRNVSNANYVPPVRDQASCGSCYAFASMAGLEARLRIATNNDRQDIFSPQDIVDCSLLSQGCLGGFNYLIAGRYAQDQGVVNEACNTYVGTDGECSTDMTCDRTYVSEYDYIGGYYGACNEELMMEALVAGGPYPVSYMVHADFYTYEGGIYAHSGLRSDFNPLILTSHAVLLVGYGHDVETGLDYWTLKNSWGESWGESGFFRIVRGTNDCGIESAGFVMTIIP